MTDGLKDAHREAVIAVIAANDRVERAVLFGSRATGTNTVTSDVDIALFGDRLTLTHRARLTAALEEIPMAQTVDLLLYDSIQDRALREHIRNHGVEWYPRATHQWRQGVYGRVPVEYVEEPLENLCVPERGIQTGPFGSQLHKRDYVSDGTPIVTVEHLGDNRLVHRDLPRVSDKDRDRLSKYRLKAGDIVFSRVGSVDRRALVRQEEEGWLFSGRCLRVRGDPDQIDRTFLSYFFGLNAFREHIRSIAVGATMPSLNTRLLSSIVVPHPPLSEQRAIAHILGTLDDKIELNRRMNETLEAMARALFKSWFVDFDPVRAKMEGRDTGLPQDIADLFPDRLVDSEMGEIPMGWEVKELGDLCHKPQYGYTASAQSEPVGPHFLRITDINKESWVSWSRVPYCKATDDEFSKYRLSKGDLLVARMADPGHGTLVEEDVEAVFASYLIRFRPVESKTARLLQYWLKSDAYWHLVRGRATGTTRRSLNARILKGFPLVFPPNGVAAAFAGVVGALRDQVVANVREMELLGSIRDTLLPKLISGQIRVGECNNAEAILNEVG